MENFLFQKQLLNSSRHVGVSLQVLMLRRFLTWLRATWVVRVLPLDQNILLHQIVGYAILCYTLVHTIAHVLNFGTNVEGAGLMVCTAASQQGANPEP